MASFQAKILEPLKNNLTDRQKEVLDGRFGLGKAKEPQTLEAIGKKYGVTRERIRQIEAVSLKSLGETIKGHKGAQAFLQDGATYLADKGGVLVKDALVSRLAKSWNDLRENHLDLLLAASNAFHAQSEDEGLNAFYYSDKAAKDKANSFLTQWVNTLNNKKDEVLASPATYRKELDSFIRAKKVDSVHAANYLGVSTRIHKNSFGDIGLRDWPEINPKTIRDRIYLVLKKHGKPVHFSDVAGLINNAKFDKKVALASTVHNEFIKDERFVLVGRGMYALREHGYEPGTAKEVIHRLLKDEGPLAAEKIVLAVQKERFFKENTILVNLQNKSLFVRRPDGMYHVREA